VTQLIALQHEIAARAAEIGRSHPDWPCRKGCDHCCRHLAAEPELTAAEWLLLRQGIDALPPEVRARVEAGIRALRGAARPIVCPMLDETSGACLVYDQRPIACRTYGFYVERGEGLYCGAIEAEVADGRMADVVWGNQCAVEVRLQELGGRKGISEWCG
jgi:Fe-S-cluster containining protein